MPMNNTIEYFYNIKPQNINNNGNTYNFTYNNEKYYFKIYDRKEDIKIYVSIINELKYHNILISEIIKNKENNYITYLEGAPYYLLKININENIPLKLKEILYLSNYKLNIRNELVRSNWSNLWVAKVDYLENQIKEMGKKHPILVESFNYYAGLTENAISYINDTISDYQNEAMEEKVISHRKISNNLNIIDVYDPINIIIDHKTRDISEYIKKSFFNKSNDIYNELKLYFKTITLSEYDARLLFGRLLYPSYYYEVFDNIIQDIEDENAMLLIIDKIKKYEEFLKDILTYLKKTYNIKDIEWLK